MPNLKELAARLHQAIEDLDTEFYIEDWDREAGTEEFKAIARELDQLAAQ
jgi:hypothetical protein